MKACSSKCPQEHELANKRNGHNWNKTQWKNNNFTLSPPQHQLCPRVTKAVPQRPSHCQLFPPTPNHQLSQSEIWPTMLIHPHTPLSSSWSILSSRHGSRESWTAIVSRSCQIWEGRHPALGRRDCRSRLLRGSHVGTRGWSHPLAVCQMLFSRLSLCLHLWQALLDTDNTRVQVHTHCNPWR